MHSDTEYDINTIVTQFLICLVSHIMTIEIFTQTLSWHFFCCFQKETCLNLCIVIVVCLFLQCSTVIWFCLTFLLFDWQKSWFDSVRYCAWTWSDTYYTCLCDRVGQQHEEDTQNSSDLDGETAWLALKPKEGEKQNSVNREVVLHTSVAFWTHH